MLGAAVHPIPPPLCCQQKARGAGGTGSAQPPVLLPRGARGGHEPAGGVPTTQLLVPRV